MNVFLMHADRDWDQAPALTRRFRSFRPDPASEVPATALELMHDLGLAVVIAAMGGGDEYLLDAARRAVLAGWLTTVEDVRYRQEILRDSLTHAAVIRKIYALAVDAVEARRHYYISDFTRHPSSVLYSSTEAMQKAFIPTLRSLRDLADKARGGFESHGLATMLAMLSRELGDDYLAAVEQDLEALRFPDGVLMSARLGEGQQGVDYRLHEPPSDRNGGWFGWLRPRRTPGYHFRLHERDEAGAKALSVLRDRAVALAAQALGQSLDHIVSFFDALRAELAFYVGCLNLHDALAASGSPVAFPSLAPAGAGVLRATGLYDVGLALTMRQPVVGNAIDAGGARLIVITGANRGGKSTFLRSVGLAQVMAQAGMFVGADSFASELCANAVTHFKREEDRALESGKLDEELRRMGRIADDLRPGTLLLFNESFASTNELEGSEIARQVTTALVEGGVRVLFVTQLHEFARSLFDRRDPRTLFLRAEREPDGTRTFHVVPAPPIETSHAEDIYRRVFGEPGGPRATHEVSSGKLDPAG